MKVSNFKANCVEIIKANLNGRKVVCYGDVDRELENYMNEHGLQIAFRVLRNKSLCDGEKLFDASILDSMVSEYYVICFMSTNSDKDTAWIRDYGYQQGRDYMFMASPITVVPKCSVNWYDKKGNTCNYCPENCKITFMGNNSEVHIATNIKIKKQLNLRLGDDCKVYIGDKVIIKEGNWLLNGDCILLEVMESVTLHKSDFILYSNSNFTVGDNTTAWELLTRLYYNTTISIGKDCLLSVGIKMYSGDGHAIFDAETGERINLNISNKQKSTIEIGDHVWIGGYTKFLNGTNVGSGSITGMGAVVKGKFPNNCSIAGNPAKVIRKNIAWSRNIMDMDISACGDEYINMTDDSYEEDE